MGANPTSYDVARRAGVSQSAVSRCFRQGGSVSAETRAKVQEAARALGYAPNKIARSLTTRRSRILGVLVTESTTASFPGLLPELGREIQAAEHRMLVFILPGGGDARSALADILAYHVDGVVSGVSLSDEILTACAGRRVPVVLYNRTSRHPWASSVGCDDVAAMDALATHLRAGGIRRVAVLFGPSGSTVSEARMRAMRSAARMHGLKVLGAAHADFTYDGGWDAAPGLLAGSARPDAVVCANDAMALGVMDRCRYDLGLRVPDDVAVTGYDDVAEGARPTYGLTTLSQPLHALCRAAVRILCERLDGVAGPGERRVMPAALVCRASTRAAAMRSVAERSR